MGVVRDVKGSLHALYRILDTVEENVEKPEELSEISLRDLFQMEMHSFFMYLAAADGRIMPSEREFMNELFDKNMSIQDYVRFVKDNDIYSTSFEERFPFSLRMTIAFDLKMQIVAAIQGDDVDLLSPKIISFYLESGKAFIACDGDVDPQEIEDLKTYVGNLTGSLSEMMGISRNKNQEEDEEIGYIGGKKGDTDGNRRNESSSTLTTRTSGNNVYKESIYKVGVDIPAGKYKLFVDAGRGYYAVCSDPNCDDIVQNDNFYGQAYIDIHNGQYLDLTRCTAIPLEEAAMFDGTIYTSGEYLVGKEIPAGEYKLQADEGSRGYYALERFVGDGSREIDSNDNFSNAAYVQTTAGQILVLSRCSLRR